jgi:MoaE-MoaD fusion protein
MTPREPRYTKGGEFRACPYAERPDPTRLMQIRVLFFGALKEMTGQSSEMIDLPDGARVNDLLAHYAGKFPRFQSLQPALAVSVNEEYSRPDRILVGGDEVGVLPPVSGGAPDATTFGQQVVLRGEIQLVQEAISTAAILDHLKRPEDGAAVVFEGIVRDNTRGRRTLYLDYEAYEPMALKEMKSLAMQARERFGVNGVSIVHRVGRLLVGETSVLIVVTSAHRAMGFEACRWIIDTLKKTVPIWKKEYFEDGAVWVDGEPFPEEMTRPGDTAGQQPASK